MDIDKLRDFIQSLTGIRVKAGWKNVRTVTKWTDDAWEQAKPWMDRALAHKANGEMLDFMRCLERAESFAYDQVVAEGNLLLNEGGITMWNLIIANGSETAYNNANARTGVGNDGTTAPARTQTGLQGTTTTFKGMDTTYPTAPSASGSGVDVVFKSTFATGEANHDWKEQTIDNGATPNKNIFRTTTNLGTKASGTWTLQTTLTLS